MQSRSWSKTTRYFVLILVLASTIWVLSWANDLIGPLAVAAVLAYVLNPLVVFVNKRTNISRSMVVLLVYLLSAVVLVALAALLVPVLPEQMQGLTVELQSIILQIQESLATPLVILGVPIPLDQLLANWPGLTLTSTAPDVILNVLQATSTNVAWVLIVAVTTYYLLQDWPRLREWLLGILPTDYQGDGVRLYREVRGVWQRYLQGQLRLMLLIGVLTGLASALIGLPGAWAFGIFAGLFDVIMSVGPAVVMAVAAVVAFFAGSTFLEIPNVWFAALVLLVYGVIQTVENIWLRPRIMGNSLRLHPAIVFIGVVGSLALAGVFMALIIVPLIGSAIVIGRYLYCKILDVDPWANDLLPVLASSPETETPADAAAPAREMATASSESLDHLS